MKKLVLDFGGTFTKYALVESGKIIFKDKVSSVSDLKSRKEQYINNIDTLVEKFKNEIDQVKISTFGVVENGIIKKCWIEELVNFDISEYIKSKHGFDSTVVNDGRAALRYIKEIKKENDFVFMAIGTSIAGGIVINSEIVKGFNQSAGEFSTIPYKQGQLSDYCSATALVKATGEQDLSLVFGNDSFKEILDNFYKNLAWAIVNIINIIDTPKFYLGGGITENNSFEIEKIIKKCKELMENSPLEFNAKIEKIKIGNDAQILGAFYEK